jgi:hypothetical protein
VDSRLTTANERRARLLKPDIEPPGAKKTKVIKTAWPS